MKPYYQDSSVTIYHGKAEDVLPTLAPVDLTVTSPPYDNLRTYNGYEFDFETIAKELYRVTKPGGVVVWVVGDATIDGSETGTSFRQALYFRDVCGFNLHDTMIYEKAGTGASGSNKAYWQTFEYMLVLAKGVPITVNRIADVRNRTIGLVRQGRFRKGGNGEKPHATSELGIRPNIWRYLVGFMDRSDKTEHEAPFPEALANDHIRSWSNPGDTILDPMMGGGTTGKMARKNGCKFIGIDISEEYCELTVKRLSQEVFNFEPETTSPNTLTL